MRPRSRMADRVPRSSEVKMYMTEDEALWTKIERGDSQQGSSSKGAMYSSVPSIRVFFQVGVGLSG